MSLANNRIAELWRTFMPRRGEVAQRINGNVVSLQVYPPDYFAAFNPATPFEKWALVEVARVEALPAGMKPFVLPAGAYAVFHYQGPGGDRPCINTTSSAPGFLPRATPSTTAHTSKYWEAHTNTTTLLRKKEIWIPLRG